MKTVLKNNVIKFFIWLVLLFISYWYISNHPAEKASIFSWFEVLVQKVEVYFYKLFNSDSESLQIKFDLEKTFEELRSTAKTNSCVSSNIYDDIKETYASLRKEKIWDIENNISFYQRKVGEYKWLIDGACKN